MSEPSSEPLPPEPEPVAPDPMKGTVYRRAASLEDADAGTAYSPMVHSPTVKLEPEEGYEEPTEPSCSKCAAGVSADDKYCSECGKPQAKTETVTTPSTVVNVTVAAAAPAGKVAHRTLTDMDEDDLTALAKVIAAKRSPVDRWIMKILAIVAVIAGGYFTARTESGITSVEETSVEIAQLADTVDQLDDLLHGADERIQGMEAARAGEINMLSTVVQRLQDLERAMQLALVQNAIRRAALAFEPLRGGSGVTRMPVSATLLAKRDKIIQRVQEQTQQQFPNIGEQDAREQAQVEFDRYVEQVREQEQEQEQTDDR